MDAVFEYVVCEVEEKIRRKRGPLVITVITPEDLPVSGKILDRVYAAFSSPSITYGLSSSRFILGRGRVYYFYRKDSYVRC